MGRKEHQREEAEFHALASEAVELWLLDDCADLSNVLDRLAEHDPRAAVVNLTAFGAGAVELLAEATGVSPEQAVAAVRERGYGGLSRPYQSAARQLKNEKARRKSMWRGGAPEATAEDT